MAKPVPKPRLCTRKECRDARYDLRDALATVALYEQRWDTVVSDMQHQFDTLKGKHQELLAESADLNAECTTLRGQLNHIKNTPVTVREHEHRWSPNPPYGCWCGVLPPIPALKRSWLARLLQW